MVHSSDKVETHHGVAKSRGGEDEEWNLHPLSEYDHAETHAIDFVLFEIAPDFDFRMKGWRMLPLSLRKAVRKEKARRMRENNPSHNPQTLEKKKETFIRNGSHNFRTPEGREKNRQRAIERNKESNSTRCSCLICKKECSRSNMGKHLRACTRRADLEG